MMNTNQQAAPLGAPGAAPGAAPGPVVCVAAQGDGTFMVYMEGTGPEAGQPAQDMSEVAMLLDEMLGGGRTDEQGAASSTAEDADALFQGGFDGVRGTGLGK